MCILANVKDGGFTVGAAISFLAWLLEGLRWPWLHACCCCALANGVIVVACQAWCDGFCCFVGAATKMMPVLQLQWFRNLVLDSSLLRRHGDDETVVADVDLLLNGCCSGDGNIVKMEARVSGCVKMKMMMWQHGIGLDSLVEIKPMWLMVVGQF
ncbi:hypothetical protein DEO72_LG4g809 [Vigna unguiculata]|uniref:Uncharacterized protein n=1 Tax=Vigna unguiculata TaxID=3917 RepID=A0A4D6LM40_VIGUN|nr:hypothetical protein DEO72_LG4g809 [Vigna unguiculata]